MKKIPLTEFQKGEKKRREKSIKRSNSLLLPWLLPFQFFLALLRLFYVTYFLVRVIFKKV